jgi:poly(A) polymerase/tRNA nucleotidyltransferase (CCA-adding enzyme)
MRGGFEAYLVGGCVRDLLLGRTPKDWDLATNAKPQEIQTLLPDSVYENEFGTVGVKTRSEDPTLAVVEVTTYRVEGSYRDFRHPDEIAFASCVEDDLARRDFTVNAMALAPDGTRIIDPFDGKLDFEAKLIRAVGNPTLRFREDALRLMRAVRLATELGFTLEPETAKAVHAERGLLREIAVERIRDEFIKLIMAPRAGEGVRALEEYGLLEHVIPELREGIGCGQNLHHIYTVFEHNVRALEYAASKDYPLPIRLGALLHDVGKPRTKRGEGKTSTFYNHEVVGGRMTRVIMERLKFSADLTERVTHLVRQHLFYYNVSEVSAAGVRRFIARVGIEMVDDILKIREADRIGSGVPKAFPYKLRHLQFMIDKVRRDPVHPKMLALNGEEIMRLLTIPAGPVVGKILRVLLDEVLEDPSKNTKVQLSSRAKELAMLSDDDLDALDHVARAHMEAAEAEAEADLKRMHRVN